MARWCEVEEFQQVIDLSVQRWLWKTPEAADQLEILAAGKIGVQVRLFRYVAETLLVGDEILAYVDSIKVDVAACGLDEASEDFNGCAFAGAVRAEITEYLASLNLKGDILYGGDARVELGESLYLSTSYLTPRIDFGSREVYGVCRRGRGKHEESKPIIETDRRFFCRWTMTAGRPCPR